MECFKQQKRVRFLLTLKDSKLVQEVLTNQFLRKQEEGDLRMAKELDRITDNLQNAMNRTVRNA